jgi:hypothetical protein
VRADRSTGVRMARGTAAFALSRALGARTTNFSLPNGREPARGALPILFAKSTRRMESSLRHLTSH